MKNLFVFVLTVSTLIGCSDAPVQKASPAITGRELDARFSSAWNRKDSASILQQLSDSVMVLSGAVLYNGLQEAKERWIRNELPIAGNLRTTILRSGQDEATAYSLGRFALDVAPPGAKPFELSGNYSFMWRRSGDSSWKLVTMLIEDLPVKP